MFLLKAFFPGNEFWKYLVGSVVIIIASTVGQLPLLGVVMYKLLANGKSMNNITESTLMTTLDKNVTLFLILLSFVVAFLGIWIVLKFIHSQRMKDIITSRPHMDWGRVFFAFSIWALIQIIVTVVSYYTSPEEYKWNFQLGPFALLFIIAVIMIPIQTTVEELVFRGYLMQGFGLLAKNRWFPLILTSLIFGGLHFFNPEVSKMGSIVMIFYIGTGLFLGIMTLMDEGTELALGFHAANNLITALLVTSEWSALQTHSILKDVSNPSAGFEIVLPVLIIFPIVLLVFSKRYKWSNWKEKLTGKIENQLIESNVLE